MAELRLTPEVWEFIEGEIKSFNERTMGYHDMSVDEVLFSFIHSTEDSHHVLTDWDEGEPNDPYWNKERNEHSCYSFLFDMNVKLKEKFTQKENPPN